MNPYQMVLHRPVETTGDFGNFVCPGLQTDPLPRAEGDWFGGGCAVEAMTKVSTGPAGAGCTEPHKSHRPDREEGRSGRWLEGKWSPLVAGTGPWRRRQTPHRECRRQVYFLPFSTLPISTWSGAKILMSSRLVLTSSRSSLPGLSGALTVTTRSVSRAA